MEYVIYDELGYVTDEQWKFLTELVKAKQMTTEQVLQAAIDIHKKKRADYATDANSNPFENFDRQAVILSWFNKDVDRAFVGLIAVKLARLGALLSSDREPQNESIEDSFIDLITYCALWAGKRLQGKDNIKSTPRDNNGHTLSCATGNFVGCTCDYVAHNVKPTYPQPSIAQQEHYPCMKHHTGHFTRADAHRCDLQTTEEMKQTQSNF